MLKRIRLSLRGKLTATYLAIGLTLTFTNIVSGLLLQRRWENVSDERARTVDLAEELAATADDAFEAGFAYVLTGKPERKSACERRLALFGAHLEQVRQRVSPNSEVANFLLRLRTEQQTAARRSATFFAGYERGATAQPDAMRDYEAAMNALSDGAGKVADLVRAGATVDDDAERRALNGVLVIIAIATGILAVAMGAVFGHHLTRPLGGLRAAAERVGRGELEIGPLQHSADELGEVAVAFEEMTGNIRKLLATVAEQGRRFEDVFASLNEMLLVGGVDGRVLAANKAACATLGFAETELIGKRIEELFDASPADDLAQLERRILRRDGTGIVVSVSTATLRTSRQEAAAGSVCVLEDLTARRALEADLRQAQKLEAMGRLSAGIAHEINTPAQFVSDSIIFAQEGLAKLLAIMQKQQAVAAALSSGASTEEPAAEAEALAKTAKLPRLLEELPRDLARAKEGLTRITNIVKSMKVFAYPDQQEMQVVDLNQSISATLTVARHEYKDVAELETELSELPPVKCHIGEVNQAVLNLVVNAAHAIADKHQNASMGKITVRTRLDGESVIVSVSDTGGGIPAAIRDRIFEPFFTTKGVGRGTGQGLAVVHSVVVDRHRGSVTLDTEAGQGTTFHLHLLIDGPAAAKTDDASAAVSLACDRPGMSLSRARPQSSRSKG